MGRTSDSREKLIQSAIELIGQKSYSSVGVQELCKHAGVKKGSFYHFFDSKKDLTITSLDEMWNYYEENVLSPVAELDVSLEDKFDIWTNKAYDRCRSSKECSGCIAGCPFGNLAMELSTQDEEIRLKIEQIFRNWIEYFERLIRKAVEKGELPYNTDTYSTAKSIIAYLEGISLIGKAFNSPDIVKNLGCVVKNIVVCNAELH